MLSLYKNARAERQLDLAIRDLVERLKSDISPLERSLLVPLLSGLLRDRANLIGAHSPHVENVVLETRAG